MKYISTVMMTLLLVVSVGTPAAEKKDKAAKRAAMMMEKLKQDHASEVANLQSKLDAEKLKTNEKVLSLEGQSGQLKRKLNSSQKVMHDLQSEKEQLLAKQEALTKDIVALELALKEEREQLSQARSELKVNDAQRKVLLSKLAESSKNIESCQEKNQKLSNLGSDLIDLYDKPSLYEKLTRSEPFFQLKRVELENILQDHDDKLRQLSIDKQN